MLSDCGAAPDTRLLIAKFLDEMPDKLREAFVLFELKALNASEVANALHLPFGTVPSRVRPERELIRANLATKRRPL
jgi:DNA-directed RNA polymerase specialized sigma24 family protein